MLQKRREGESENEAGRGGCDILPQALRGGIGSVVADDLSVLLDKSQVLLLKQYRHALRDHILEIPAGTMDGRETALNCAQRELVEETGHSAKDWQKLGVITPVPGYSDERIHMFLATGLKPAAQDLDQDEIIRVYEVELDEALEMIKSGQIQDAKSIAGLYLASCQLQYLS